jgi:hypothetical protein
MILSQSVCKLHQLNCVLLAPENRVGFSEHCGNLRQAFRRKKQGKQKVGRWGGMSQP